MQRPVSVDALALSFPRMQDCTQVAMAGHLGRGATAQALVQIHLPLVQAREV